MDEHLGERLSAYADGDLEGGVLERAEAHLAACEECRSALQDMRRVLGLARALDDRPPARDLWPGIAERIGAPGQADVVPLAPRRRFAFSIPQLAAAGVALALFSAAAGIGAFRMLVPGLDGGTAAVPTLAGERAAVARPVAGAEASYESAIRELEAVLAARRGYLDTATVRAVETSLMVIDRAISQARDALRRDPNNLYLNGELRNTLNRKLDLLRRAAMLPRIS